jgi:hypothetical protein
MLCPSPKGEGLFYCRKPNTTLTVVIKQPVMQKKSFKITCSLQEGYGEDGRIFTFTDAERVIANWLNERLNNNLPFVSGLLQQGSLIFPAPQKVAEKVSVSPTVIFDGELSSEQDMQRDDNEVKGTLRSLALQLKEKLKQESVFVIYLDEHWCV